jgi:hypothetical protein
LLSTLAQARRYCLKNNEGSTTCLSSEADALTRLVLARQMLICRALELDTRAEVLTVTGPAVCSWEAFHAVYAELALVPGLLENLDVEISAAQRRLKAAWRRRRPSNAAA